MRSWAVGPRLIASSSASPQRATPPSRPTCSTAGGSPARHLSGDEDRPGGAGHAGPQRRAWLCGQTGIDPSRVGLIGFCLGGGYALLAGAGWAAVSTNYGMVPQAEVMRALGPVIGCYGSRDKMMAKEPERLRQRLAAVGHDPPEIHFFDAGHSFLTDAKVGPLRRMLPLMHLGDHPAAREEGWQHIFGFFDRHLRAA